MNLCNSGHEEVCYDSGLCPAYELLDEISVLKSELEYEKRQATDLERRLDQANEEKIALENELYRSNQ